MSNDNYPNQNNENQNERHENVSRSNQQSKNKMPWNRGFGQDENPKKRQFSRSARNQPNKEATTLSKVLLFLIVVVLISPFMLYWAVNATRKEEGAQTSSMENLSINRSISESESKSEESDESSSESESASSEESVSSIEIEESSSVVEQSSVEVPETPIQPPVESAEVYVPETPVIPETPATGSYTIQAGDSWWSISVSFGVDVYELVQMNGATIETPIYPGMQIVVP